MSRKPKPEEHIHLSPQKKAVQVNEEPFESLKTRLAKRQKLAESEGVRLSPRHLDALPLHSDGTTNRFVDDWEKVRY